MNDGKTTAIAKIQNLIGAAIFVSPGEFLMSYVPNCTTKLHPYLQKKQNRLRRPMSIDVLY